MPGSGEADTAAVEAARRRTLWRTRRGMAELDTALGAFLRSEPQLSEREWETLERLLGAPDPVLLEWLMGRATPADSDQAALVGRIRRHAAD